ncbi:MAG: metalloregulator ArsR/SmtB family transcription factor [Magnetospirillum sp. WYHS-4]
MENDFACVADAIGHSTRTRILRHLETGEASTAQLREALDLAPATVNRHLTILRRAGLVFIRHEGRRTFCRLADHSRNPHVRPALWQVLAGLESRAPAAPPPAA